MKQRNPASATELIDRLSQLGDLRVWSVIITIFGDAVMPRGGTVSAGALSAITDRLSIKPEALRVALYRLAKDGWIIRSKSGRNSFYALSGTGRAEFLPATRRIYATAPALRGPWHLAGLEPAAEKKRLRSEKQLRAQGFLPLSPGLFLGSHQTGQAPNGTVVVTGDLDDLPGWARAALAPPSLQKEFDVLAGVLTACQQRVAGMADADPLDAVALRTLVIHHWRRLLLRHADLPSDLLPAGWRGEECRALVLDIHGRLSPLANPWLDEAIGPHLAPRQPAAAK